MRTLLNTYVLNDSCHSQDLGLRSPLLLIPDGMRGVNGKRSGSQGRVKVGQVEPLGNRGLRDSPHFAKLVVALCLLA